MPDNKLKKQGATRVGVVSLGCAKNLVDTEVMLGYMQEEGCTFVEQGEEADVMLINTCSFIGPAREESVQTILEAAELKRRGEIKRVVVSGCLVQRYAGELKESLPEVDAFIGLDNLDEIGGAVNPRAATPLASDLPLTQAVAKSTDRVGKALDPARQSDSIVASRYLYDHDTPRLLASRPWSAYLKIAEGCDHICSFCAIPAFRGTFRSRTTNSIVAEAERLAQQGVREVNLIAQDSSHFGRDRGEMDGLAQLLAGLNRVEQLRWVRVHYLYPNTVTPRLIDTMAASERVLDYVDMPLQHAHPDMLKRMRRGGSAESHLKLLARFRAAMPDATLRTTLIVGFPGETDAEFQTLMDFVREARFEHLGVFTYSHEEQTSALEYADDVPEELKQERRAQLLELQQERVLEQHQQRIGQVVDVLIEGVHADTEHLLVGRSWRQAPDVDGQILINDGSAEPGQFARVELTEVAGYDLVGRVLDAA